MKKILFPLLLLSIFLNGYPQSPVINFEDPVHYLEIDTTNPANIWQIGSPHKTTFTSSFSLPKAIVTDTIHHYPINNNSIFYLYCPGWSLTEMGFADIHFKYKVDCDEGWDYGKIEYSINGGITYTNIFSGPGSYYFVTDSLQNTVPIYYPQVFTGLSNGWYNFHCYWNPSNFFIDTMIYRFTFHSVTTSMRDGWMIDDIENHLSWENIDEPELINEIYPNPVKAQLSIRSQASVLDYDIIDMTGKIITHKNSQKLSNVIDVSELSPGLYFLRFKSSSKQYFKKFQKI